MKKIRQIFDSIVSPKPNPESLHHPGQPHGTSIERLLEGPKDEDLFSEIKAAPSVQAWNRQHPVKSRRSLGL